MKVNATKLTIYAVGGGHGHAVRALTLAEILKPQVKDIQVIIRTGSLNCVSGISRCKNIIEVSTDSFCNLPQSSTGTLIVDTFEQGWSNELTEAWLNNFAERIFVARYRKKWLEYPKTASCIGLLCRNTPFQFTAGTGNFALIDTENRASKEFRKRLASILNSFALDLSIYSRIPSCLSAEKILIIGAGYNTFYELFKTKTDIRFLPLKKQHDDQKRRTRLYQKGVESFVDIYNWLDSLDCDFKEKHSYINQEEVGLDLR
jgi:hypothetical protein